MRRHAISAAVLASVPSSSAQWWRGAPQCAQSCLSSAWPATPIVDGSSTVTPAPGVYGGGGGWGWGGNGGYWPSQGDYCGIDKGAQVSSCLQHACSSTLQSYFTSYSSLSSSLCSRYQSCTVQHGGGSDFVQTITYSGGPVTWGAPGGWDDGTGGGWRFDGQWEDRRDPPRGPGGGNGNGPWGWGAAGATDAAQASSYWSAWSSAWVAGSTATWPGAVVTVTGCDNIAGNFEGSPWLLGPGCGWNGRGGFNGWVGWGSGWSWGPTSTQTVHVTVTDDTGGVPSVETSLAMVALAVSGDVTTAASTIGVASPTGGVVVGSAAGAPAPGFGAGGAEGSVVTRMVKKLRALATKLKVVVNLTGTERDVARKQLSAEISAYQLLDDNTSLGKGDRLSLNDPEDVLGPSPVLEVRPDQHVAMTSMKVEVRLKWAVTVLDHIQVLTEAPSHDYEVNRMEHRMEPASEVTYDGLGMLYEKSAEWNPEATRDTARYYQIGRNLGDSASVCQLGLLRLQGMSVDQA
ncbi:hypothetical protein Micbo1qcDRAFT_179833 [Microdochium bolleyi]|uniref:Uncharacterized protein n=1 Tax=Microdochium bolleyi TaxID=196109 RepID=A0A136INX5_9PEZI|nr:hypothetical protein Micbo1qcDRAFT_179833 [Microdochium bolleyi]